MRRGVGGRTAGQIVGQALAAGQPNGEQEMRLRRWRRDARWRGGKAAREVYSRSASTRRGSSAERQTVSELLSGQLWTYEAVPG